SSRRASLRSRCACGSKSLTSPATRDSNSEASKRVIGPVPEQPATAFCQDDSASRPSGVTMPTPVTTTRREGRSEALEAVTWAIVSGLSQLADDGWDPGGKLARKKSGVAHL